MTRVVLSRRRPAAAGAVRLAGRDDVLRLIRRRQRSGEALRRDAVVDEEPRLELAARMHFGSWREAVEAAGFRPTGLRSWTRERIIGELRTLDRRGAPLASSQVPIALKHAAIAYFGSWHSAIKSSGLQPIRVVKSDKEIIAVLRRGARSGRTGIGPDGFVDWPIYDLAHRRFGSFRAALEAARLDPGRLLQRGRYPTGESVTDELRRIARKHPNLTFAELRRRRDVTRPAVSHFGSLAAAVDALGISGWPKGKRRGPRLAPLTRDDVVAGIRDRHRRREPMHATSALASEPRLTMGAYRLFGSWRAAVRAAGLAALVQDGGTHRISVRNELKGRRLRREPLTQRAIERDDPGLWHAIKRRHGSLAGALRDLGQPLRKSQRVTRRRGRSR